MLQSYNYPSETPHLGVGLGYRRELSKEIFVSKDKIDFLEIITDRYIESDEALNSLKQVCELFQLIPHGIGLSIGSATPFDTNYLQAIKRVSDFTNSPYYSEHLCVTKAPGINIGHLSPLWFTSKVLKKTISNVAYVQDYLGKPLILENIAYLVDIPTTEMSQVEFFNELVKATGCGILLDITNLFINSVNHNYDPTVFLDQIELDRVAQVHLAGGYWSNGILIDSHSELVQDESWKLLKDLASKTKIKGIVIEHDANFPDIDLLLEQISRAKTLIEGVDILPQTSKEISVGHFHRNEDSASLIFSAE